MFGFHKNSVISAQEAKKRMDEGGRYVLLDVRNPVEFSEGHIEGAKLIPVDELNLRAARELPDRDVLILVYCRSGARAGNAVQILERLGYTNVVSFGGIMSWPYGQITDNK